MKTFISIISFFITFSAFSAEIACPEKNWKLSKMEFSPTDPYLVTVLGFSYGPEVRKFIPKLSGAISRFYYDGTQSNSKVTFFSTYYSEDADAKDAFDHLKAKTAGLELQTVVQKGKQVIWFGGRDISKECFKRVFEVETKKL